MPNFERIQHYSKEELVSFLCSVNKDPLFGYKDILSWLSSEEEKPSFLGDDGTFTNRMPAVPKENAGDGKPVPCKILSRTTMMGQPYMQIIVDGMLMKVPEECVTYDE